VKKNNTKTSQRGLKRDVKNKARKKRSESKYNFNDLVHKVKTMQQFLNKDTFVEDIDKKDF